MHFNGKLVVTWQESLVTTGGVQHQHVTLNTANPFDLSMQCYMYVLICMHACMYVLLFYNSKIIYTQLCVSCICITVCSTDHCMYMWDNMIMQSLGHIVQ